MKIVNLVGSGSLNQVANLDALAHAHLIDYDPNYYHGGYIKTCNHPITLYRSGKYIITGSKSFEDLIATYRQMKDVLIAQLDVSLFDEPKVRNIVCTSDYGNPLDLTDVYIRLLKEGFEAEYELESFPGLILRLPECTYNIFSSGKFLILGCTNEKDAEVAEGHLIELIGKL